MLPTTLRVALMVTLALTLTEVHAAALKRSLQETAPRYALRCGDGGGRDARTNLEYCKESFGHCSSTGVVTGGKDEFCDWCNCDDY